MSPTTPTALISALHVILENVHVTNDEDCIVLKQGANYVHAKDITCIGSHGLSVGSLGRSSTANDAGRAVL